MKEMNRIYFINPGFFQNNHVETPGRASDIIMVNCLCVETHDRASDGTIIHQS
jgi:hypothetical protein